MIGRAEKYRVTVCAVQPDGRDSPLARVSRVFVFDPGLDDSWDVELDGLVGDVAAGTRRLVEVVSIVRPMVPDC